MKKVTELLIEKYKPKTIKEFIGNHEVIEHVLKWANEWQKEKQQKPLFFYGQTGSGKTLLASLIAKEFNWQLFELNASDFRTKEDIERLAGTAAQNATFSAEKRLILIDEIDGLSSVDRGGLNAIIKIVRETRNPLILIANDIYADKSFATLRNLTETLQFKKVNYLTLSNYMKSICEKEGIQFDDSIEVLAKNSSGDVRAALLDLQNYVTKKKLTKKELDLSSYREREENIFNILKELFKVKTFNEAKKIVNKSNFDLELLAAWIEENIPAFDSKDTARAFDYFSRADIYNGRIFNKQYYGFQKYSTDLSIPATVVSREKEYSWIKFNFPSILKKLSSSMKARNIKKSIALKLGRKIHASSKQVMQEDFSLLELLFSNKEQAIRFSAEFDFNEEEIAFLLKSSSETKKVQTIFEEAQRLKEKNILERLKGREEQEEIKPVTIKETEESKGRQATLF